jgi:hypothetical protein
MCRNFRSIEWHQKHTTKSHNTVHFRFSICLQWARLNYFEGIDILEYFYPILQYRCLPIFYSKKLFLRQSAYLLCCKLSLKINQTVYILPLILMIISRWSPYTSDLVNNYFTDNTEKVWGLVFGFCWEIYRWDPWQNSLDCHSTTTCSSASWSRQWSGHQEYAPLSHQSDCPGAGPLIHIR